MPKTKKSLTIRQIAALAEVSVSAVSKVLNNRSDVSPSTRQKVTDIIRKNNYRRRVSTVRSKLVGVVFPSLKADHITSAYVSTLLAGLTDFFFEKDIRVELIKEEQLPHNGDDFFQFCMEANLSGVIVLLSLLSDHYLGKLGSVFPVVVTGNNLGACDAVCVRYDALCAGRKATAHLLELGHRNIGFIAEDQLHHDQVYRCRGYRETLEASGIQIVEDWIFDLQRYEMRDIVHRLEYVLGKPGAPTAFVVSNDNKAVEILDILRSIGKVVPRDISIIGFDDLPFARHLAPPLTTVSQPIYRIGYQAGQGLFDLMAARKGSKPQDVVLDCELIIRASTAPLAGR